MTSAPIETAETTSPTSRDRRRFKLAIGLFVAWIGILLAMDYFSANRPGVSIAPPAESEGTTRPR